MSENEIPDDFKFVSLNGFVQKRVYEKYRFSDFNIGAKFQLIREFLTINKSIAIDDKFYSKFTCNDENVFLIKLIVRIENDLINGIGVHLDYRKAHDMAADQLIHKIIYHHVDLIMPSYLMTLPNWRGHCFLNSAILPLFHCQVFIQQLFVSFLNCSSLLGTGKVVNPLKRRNLTSGNEPADLWICALYNFHRKLRKASQIEGFSIRNIPPSLPKKLYPDQEIELPPKQRPFNDIDLDKQQMLLLRHLSDFCSAVYEEPGGTEHEAYSDLIRKLANNDKAFHQRFMFVVKTSFICKYCPSFSCDMSYSFPVLYLPGPNCKSLEVVKISELIKRPQFWRDFIPLTCPNIINGSTCGGGYKRLENVTLVQLPELLAISLRGPLMEDINFVIDIEEEFELIFQDKIMKYKRIAFSSVFMTYQDSDNVSKGCRFRAPEPGDEPDCWHTCVNILTNKGFIEVNNGDLFNPVPELLYRYTEGSLVFFQLEKYSWRPKLLGS